MSVEGRKRTVWVVLGVAVSLALGAWVAGGQIRSPAQVAAETAPPKASDITVPVERRVLSSEVIVRGTVRYGSPQAVVLATSSAKQNSGGSGGDIVTSRPRRGARFGEGSVVMSASGRPVFVLRGGQPTHRDLAPGSRGPDVRQLETALVRMGFSPGSIDGRYDGRTAAAVAAWYERSGYEPFGATDSQLDQLRAAKAAAAAARDTYLQNRISIKTAAENATPAEVEQARIELGQARDAVDTAQRDLAAGRHAVQLAIQNQRKDNAVALAEVAAKRAAVNKALDAQDEARRNLAEAPPDTSPSERAALQAAVRGAADDVVVAQTELSASNASARATRAAGRDAVATARADRARASSAVPRARRQVVLSSRRLRVLNTPNDTSLQRQLAAASAEEARDTAADVARLARRMGVTVPADELLFFPTLPLRVDSVRVRRGDSISGRVMTVSNSRLAVDSSLSLDDAKLVRPGASVKIEEPDLGIKTTGTVRQVADAPGTHGVDPGRVYLEIAPGSAPAQLVGASVKLTIAVKSTEQAVLVVPVTALSVGADGNSRVQVQRSNGQTEYVTVEPGLAAKGLVEVRPVSGRLAVGDLVITGAKNGKGDTSSVSTPPEGTPESQGSGAGDATTPGGGEGTGSGGNEGTTSGKDEGGNSSSSAGGQAPTGTAAGSAGEGTSGAGGSARSSP